MHSSLHCKACTPGNIVPVRSRPHVRSLCFPTKVSMAYSHRSLRRSFTATSRPDMSTSAVPDAKKDQDPVVNGQPYNLSVNLQGVRDTLCLEMFFVSEDDPKDTSKVFDLNKSKRTAFRRDDPTAAGTQFQRMIELPEGFKPGAMKLKKYREENRALESPPFVASIQLNSTDTSPRIEYPAYSYIDIDQGERVVFPARKAYPGFPGFTPKGLEALRQTELADLRGTEVQKTQERKGAERVYDYDTYNDLGNQDTDEHDRPVLGGKTLKYPRRLRTGRKKIGDDEVRPPGSDLPWLPLDERFNNEKNHAFSGDTADTAGKVVRTILGTPRGLSFALSMIPFIKKMHETDIDPKNPQTIFTDLTVVDSIFENLTTDSGEDKPHPFRDLLPVTRLKTVDMLDLLQRTWQHMDTGLKRALRLNDNKSDFDATINKKKKELERVDHPPNLFGKFAHSWLRFADKAKDDTAKVEAETLGSRVDDALGLIRGILEKWPIPRVRDNRAFQWRSDEEFARAAMAGQNPLSIRAVTREDLKKSIVEDKDVKDLLEGYTLQEAVGCSRLWTLDYYDAYRGFQRRIEDLNTPATLYAGRCYLYTRKSGVTVPVAVELEAEGEDMRLYTANDPTEIWLLAKLVIASLDSGVHQLVQHWLRTHACVEPYIIASRRQLSAMNPLYKLLEPHFRYTMRINCNARKVLINAGGIVEQAFTPGPYCMELSAVVYDGWKFKEQSFPNDLIARGLAERKADGSLDIKLPNYSYAQDGLLIWNAIHEFAGDYLRLHYDDSKPGKRVTDDVEIMNWWEEVKVKGHPDSDPSEWPAITDVASLQEIAASIMWTASCHHAAVNFGQYDNSAYMPYKPSKINRKIPLAGSKQEKDLLARYEKNLLETLTDPVATIFVMITVKILSAHGTDEEYLDKDVHNYIKDEEGIKVHKKFVKSLRAAQKEIETRNASEERLRKGQGLPYTLMMPSKPGLQEFPFDRPPARGIPYSISI